MQFLICNTENGLSLADKYLPAISQPIRGESTINLKTGEIKRYVNLDSLDELLYIQKKVGREIIVSADNPDGVAKLEIYDAFKEDIWEE